MGIFCPLFKTQSVPSEFYSVYLADTAEKEPYSPAFVVNDNFGVYRVENAIFGASSDDAVKLEIVMRDLLQYTYAAIFCAVI